MSKKALFVIPVVLLIGLAGAYVIAPSQVTERLPRLSDIILPAIKSPSDCLDLSFKDAEIKEIVDNQDTYDGSKVRIIGYFSFDKNGFWVKAIHDNKGHSIRLQLHNENLALYQKAHLYEVKGQIGLPIIDNVRIATIAPSSVKRDPNNLIDTTCVIP